MQMEVCMHRFFNSLICLSLAFFLTRADLLANTPKKSLVTSSEFSTRQKNETDIWDPLIKHLNILVELKTLFAKKHPEKVDKNKNREKSLSPTQTHLKAFGTEVDRCIQQYPFLEQFIKKIIAREKKYDETDYVFYHAQNNIISMAQDIFTAYNKYLRLHHLSKFQFFRNPTALPLKETTGDFLEKNTDILDHNPTMRNKLLSVNLAFTGNMLDSGEQTLSYLLNNMSIYLPTLFGACEILGLPVAEFFDEIQAIQQEYTSRYGSLYQIFIPKDKVNECVYLSYAYGKPYSNPILKYVYDYKKQRHNLIAPILDYYKEQTDPAKIERLDHLQARILFDQSIMLNPSSGVKIIKYHHIDLSDAKHVEYTRRINQIAQKLVRKLLETGFLGKTISPLERLVSYRFQRLE